MNTHEFDDKSILIWGYGREGRSTEEFLKTACRPKKIEIFEGKKEDIREDLYDLIIKSPGIVMEEDDPKVTSQTEIFLKAHRKNTIGITGTKGKSTTSAMLYHVLRECLDRKVILLGNIGEPCLNHYEEMSEDAVAVFEMSCHQLAHTKVSPHIAVFLNLFEEHLDYYGTFEKYARAKRNITLYQDDTDVLYLGENLDISTAAKTVVISRDQVADYDLQVLGEHNDYNAEFVCRIATEQFGIQKDKVLESLKGFTGLPHRLQLLGEKDGISYYDDSISTIPSATISALRSVDNAYSVLIGGMDRGIHYEELTDFVRAHPEYAYIFMYESGQRIYRELQELQNCCFEQDLAAAVERAKRITPQGKACILSPAAASYGYFKNFEERGERFRAYVGL